MKAAIRAYENRDFPGSLRLLQASPHGSETIERLMVLLTDEGSVAMVAEDGGSLVGIAAGAAAGGPAGSGSSSPTTTRRRPGSSTRSRPSSPTVA